MITLYTDWSSIWNPWPWWRWVLIKLPSGDKKLSGGEDMTTNNRMELTAAEEALARAKQHANREPVVIFTDSKYVYDGITQYLTQRKARGRKLANKKPVLNKDLREKIDTLLVWSLAEWKWVKAHDTSIENNSVDKIARREALKRSR